METEFLWTLIFSIHPWQLSCRRFWPYSGHLNELTYSQSCLKEVEFPFHVNILLGVAVVTAEGLWIGSVVVYERGLASVAGERCLIFLAFGYWPIFLFAAGRFYLKCTLNFWWVFFCFFLSVKFRNEWPLLSNSAKIIKIASTLSYWSLPYRIAENGYSIVGVNRRYKLSTLLIYRFP